MKKSEELTEGKKARGQEGRLFNVSCHPEFISGSVHSGKWHLPWNKMLKHLTDAGSQGSFLACSLCKVQHDKCAFTQLFQPLRRGEVDAVCEQSEHYSVGSDRRAETGAAGDGVKLFAGHSRRRGSRPMRGGQDRGCRPVRGKKVAFTLAEVLITLGIIGVVAAITIPTMISHYQKRAWTAQLQRTYAVFNQGFRRMLADDGVSALSQTETFQSIGGDYIEGPDNTYKSCSCNDSIESDNCKNFYKNLGKYFKIADIKQYPQGDGYVWGNLNDNILHESVVSITLLDGTVIFGHRFYLQDEHDRTNGVMKGRAAYFKVDVNGIKGPNKLGRDIFYLWAGDNGIIYPYGSKAVSEYDAGNFEEYYWRTSSNKNYSCLLDGVSTGAGCAARVLEEGKMNY